MLKIPTHTNLNRKHHYNYHHGITYLNPSTAAYGISLVIYIRMKYKKLFCLLCFSQPIVPTELYNVVVLKFFQDYNLFGLLKVKIGEQLTSNYDSQPNVS